MASGGVRGEGWKSRLGMGGHGQTTEGRETGATMSHGQEKKARVAAGLWNPDQWPSEWPAVS